jgi:hypothetical protein
MFFECDIAKAIWCYVRDFLGIDIGSDYVSVADKWLHREKNYVANTISTAVLGYTTTTTKIFSPKQVGVYE